MKRINKNKVRGCLIVILILTFNITACKKNLEVDTPSTYTSTQSAFKNDKTATNILTGLYAQLSDNYINTMGLPATSFFEELSADNLTIYDPNSQAIAQYISFYQNTLEPTYATSYGLTYWTNTYKILYTINATITALSGNKDLSSAVIRRLSGEAYFLRGFCYFYLVNLYGEVPLILTENYQQNAKQPRNNADDIYKQIVSDLVVAESLLDNNYASGDVTQTTTDRLRPNLAAVYALEARVYLFQKNYSAAEIAASKVISQSSLYSLTTLDKTFLKNSTETIWALQPVSNGYNTREAQFYILPSDGPNDEHPAYASANLVSSFELGDDRKKQWLNSINVNGIEFVYPFKYKVPFIDGSTNNFKEYTIVLRLAEQYLIRAEARNELNNGIGAVEDLNVLRERSRSLPTMNVPNPLPDLSSELSQTQLRTAIFHERRVELFTEWGHRWFDLKRSGVIDSTMISAEQYKGGTWSNYKSLYPIPVSDILLNSEIKQNPGYLN
jgi:hypothetical protein